MAVPVNGNHEQMHGQVSENESSRVELKHLADLTSKLETLLQGLPSQHQNGLADSFNGLTLPGTQHNATSRLDGKIAIVTGAGRGIGAGIAKELAARGASVVVNYAKSEASAKAVVEKIQSLGGRAHMIKADITDVPQVTQLFEDTIAHFGAVDIVVSNSGRENFEATEDVTGEIFDQVFGLNCRAQFFVGQHAFKYCRPGGRVILMSSIAASILGPANHSLYAGSKCAVEGFTRTMAFDFGKRGITVNAIAPGGVKSDMFSHAAWRYTPGADATWGAEAIEKAMAAECPLGRCALPIDIARVVCFLASQDGEWVNGQVIRITGGSFQ